MCSLSSPMRKTSSYVALASLEMVNKSNRYPTNIMCSPSPSRAIPANFPLLKNKPLPDAQAKALRAALAREAALQTHLEQQHIEMQSEASKAQDTVSSLITCHTAGKRVHQALNALRAAVAETKHIISNTINVHDTEAEAANKLTTTTAARNAWRDLIQHLEALTPQINVTITPTEAHIINTSDQVSTNNFLAESARNSVTALDVSLDAIANSLSFKRRGLSSIFRTPNEVFQIVFQFAVEEEREQLRAEFSSSSLSFDGVDNMRRTIPKCPFTLAAVCRDWRNIALHTPRLWSYIRVYTLVCITSGIGRKSSKYCWVGKAAFERSLQRAKGATLELVMYRDHFNQIHSLNIPPDARISIIYMVRLASVPRWVPSCSRLSLFGDVNSHMLAAVQFPCFSTGPKEISCNNVLPTFPTFVDSTTAFYFCSKKSFQMPNLNQLSENLPNLKTLQLLLPDVAVSSAHATTTVPRTWKSLTTLIITSSVLPSLAVHAQGRPSLPSLTTLILTNVFASFSSSGYDSIKHIVQTLTTLEIHNISPSVKPSELRALIDWMECLHTVVLHRAPAQNAVKALSLTPAKPIKKLVIESTVLEGVELHDYTALLESKSGDSEPLEVGFGNGKAAPVAATRHPSPF